MANNLQEMLRTLEAEAQARGPSDPAARAASQFGLGANETIAAVGGAPVDIANWVMGIGEQAVGGMIGRDMTGTITTETPIGGSDSIMQAFEALGVQPDFAPANQTERIARRVGSEVGASVLPMGAVAGAVRAGATGASIIGRAILGPAARAPVATAAVETGLATAGGLGAGMANEIAPGNPLADAAGTIAGSFAPTAVTSAIRRLWDLGKSAWAVANPAASQRLVERETAASISDRAMRPEDVIESLRDPTIPDVPGFQPTTGQVTGDPGLLTAERATSRLSLNAQGQFVDRAAENAGAIRSALDEVAPMGSMQDTSRAVTDMHQRLVSALEQRFTQAETRVQEAMRTPGMRPEAASQVVAQELDMALQSARQAERSLWSGIDPEGEALLNRTELQSAFDAWEASLTTARREMVPGNIMTILRNMPDELPLAEVTDLRSAISTAARDARSGAAPNRNLANLLGEMEDVVSTYMDELSFADPAMLDRYNQARQFSRSLNDTFTRGITAQATRQGTPASAVMSRFWTTGPGSMEAAQELSRQVRGVPELGLPPNPELRASVRDYILNDMQMSAGGPEGTLNGRRLTAWLGQHEAALREFPDLQEELRNIFTAQQALDVVRAANPPILAEMERGAARFFLGNDPDKVVAAILGSRTRNADISRVMSMIGDDPHAIAGLQRGFWDHMTQSISSNIPNERGVTPLLSGRLRTYLQNNESVMQAMFTDQQMARIHAVSEAIDMAARTSRATLGGSDTAQNLAGMRQMGGRIIDSLVGAAIGGPVGAGVGIVARSALDRWLISRTQAQREALLINAFMNPEVARDLMITHASVVNEEEIVRRLRGHLVSLGLETESEED